MSENNEMTLIVKAESVNESFVRSTVAAFCVPLNPTLDEITDIKTAVSEAVTNCVVHAYPFGDGEIIINVKLVHNEVIVKISDKGVGIVDINKAIEPFYTTKPNEERSGMGFTVMESFMDTMKVTQNKGKGITVHMTKKIEGDKLKIVGG